MAMATSSRKRRLNELGDAESMPRPSRKLRRAAGDRPLEVHGAASLGQRLSAGSPGAPVPLLVVRVRDLQRIAWREGRAAARGVERRSLASFVETASRTLRATDLLAHDDDSEDFLAALVSPNRSTGAVATPTDCRATLARLAAAMECDGGMDVETGWTIVSAPGEDDCLANAVEAALERGARERERYAFFSTIGHELRTPLTSIRGYLETLIDEDLDPATARRFLEIARLEALRMGRLVDGMFDISMLDLRTEPGYAECCELEGSIASALDALAPAAAARSTGMTRRACEPYRVAIGNDRLMQILINVIDNAIKHGREGGRIVVSSAPLDRRYVEIRVDDDGPGVPAQEREVIFTLARRGTNARARGSGLGLAVVRVMLERIGGEVDVTKSALGGAQFRIRLPRMPATQPTPVPAGGPLASTRHSERGLSSR